jgi:predicted dehydrogenase
VSLAARKIVVVGLGTAGTDHARALENIPGTQVIAGIDHSASRSLTFKGQPVPTFTSLFGSYGAVEPDIVVIATPTPSHAEVCREVGEYFRDAAIVMEKPAADNLEDAQRIVEGSKQPVTVAYHMAFAPEVDWAVSEAASWAGQLGRPVAIESWNADPYQPELGSARARLGTSWIDSGINALSVIERFATPVECTSLRQIGPESQSVFQGTFRCATPDGPLTALVVTSWQATGPGRSTRVRYASGAELVLDHNAVAGYLVCGGSVRAMFGSDGMVPRREAHYRGFYKSWLTDGDQLFPVDSSLRLHRLLLGQDATASEPAAT